MFLTTSHLLPLFQIQRYNNPFSNFSLFSIQKRFIKIILTGSTGNLGTYLMYKAVQNNRNSVIGIARRKHDYEEYFKMKNCKLITFDNTNFASDSIDIIRNVTSNNEQVLFVNAIGGAHPKGSATLEDLNKKPALDFANAVRSISKEKSLKPIFVQLSSITASLPQRDRYACVKREVDNYLLTDFKDINPICIRVGFAVQQLLNIHDPSMHPEEHAYAPSELAVLPMQPIVIHGQQKIQPVTTEDVIDSILNLPNKIEYLNERKINIINAVGPKAITQEDFFRFFHDLYHGSEKPFKAFYISKEDFGILCNAFPMGHLASYAAEYLNSDHPTLCHKEFQQLTGRELKSIEEFYKVANNDLLIFPTPWKTLLKHFFQIGSKFQTDKISSFNHLLTEFSYDTEKCTPYKVLISNLTRYFILAPFYSISWRSRRIANKYLNPK
jgi:nucleoside-diphosphate-sugar epimerase